jgi:hypothetical protein
LTIAELQRVYPEDGQPRLWLYSPYANENFVLSQTCEPRWYFGLIEAVPDSVSKRWENMLPMLPSEYEVPTPIVEATKDLLYYKKHGAYPNRNVYAACDVLDSNGSRVVVGHCSGGKVFVSYWNGDPYSTVALSAFLKSSM